MLVLLVLLLAGPSKAQTFVTLHNLSAGNTNSSGIYTNADGAHPFAGLVLTGTTLYGTAQEGGSSGKGTVFTANTDGNVFTTLHSFTATSGILNGNTDGALPRSTLIAAGNTLYGTAIAGGTSGVGTVFALSLDGTSFTNLHSFTGTAVNSEGAYPYAGLILAGNTLYGTTSEGGSAGNGTVFTVNTDGTGFKNLYSFAASKTNASGFYTNADGTHPWARLTLLSNTLYGTASEGGSAGAGTVFALKTDGTGFVNLHSFSSLNSDGAYPSAGLTLSGNTLYGTTEFGGSAGSGAVFAINTDGLNFRIVYSFTGGVGGARPTADLILSGNTLYGTAGFGGAVGAGTVFALNTDGAQFTILYSFSGSNDGVMPYAGLVMAANTLYGTAAGGGNSGLGTLFRLSSDTAGRPRLTIFPSGPNVVLMWPTNASGFTLQATATLTPPTVWTPVLSIPVLVNGQNTVTNTISGTQQFFRLIQ